MIGIAIYKVYKPCFSKPFEKIGFKSFLTYVTHSLWEKSAPTFSVPLSVRLTVTTSFLSNTKILSTMPCIKGNLSFISALISSPYSSPS
jgi:hypothetical protein